MVFVFENTKQISIELIPDSWRHLSTPRATWAFYFEPLHEATAPEEGLIHSQAGFPRQEARAGQSRGQSQASHPSPRPGQRLPGPALSRRGVSEMETTTDIEPSRMTSEQSSLPAGPGYEM